MTAQIHENLILNGRRTSMAFVPPLPQRHPALRARARDEWTDADHDLLTTACWRGYQGTWELRDGWLYLVGLRGRLVLDADAAPLRARWFSGVLRIPQGGTLRGVNMGFATVHERELHVAIEAGRVFASRGIDRRGVPHDRNALAWQNLPGSENRFDGDGHWQPPVPEQPPGWLRSVRHIAWCVTGAGIGVALALLLARPAVSPLLLASLGGSAVLLFGLPGDPAARPRALWGGHLACVTLGLLCARVFGHGPWVAALALLLGVAVMLALRCVHPPAGAAAMLVAHAPAGAQAPWEPLLAGVATLAVVAFLWRRWVPRAPAGTAAPPRL